MSCDAHNEFDHFSILLDCWNVVCDLRPVEERALCASVSNRWLADMGINVMGLKCARSSTGRGFSYAAANVAHQPRRFFDVGWMGLLAHS